MGFTHKPSGTITVPLDSKAAWYYLSRKDHFLGFVKDELEVYESSNQLGVDSRTMMRWNQ